MLAGDGKNELSYSGLTRKHSYHNEARIGILLVPSLYCQLQEDKATRRWCAFLENVSVTTYDLI